MPIFWAPITIYLFLRSLFQFTGPLPTFFENPTIPLSHVFSIPADSVVKTMLCFFLGNLVWTILEYTLHRFLFHVDRWLPDKPLFLMLHFTAHGVHHYLPMDRYVFLESIVGCKLTQKYVILISKIEAGHASATVLHPSTPFYPTRICNLSGSYCEWYHLRELYFL